MSCVRDQCMDLPNWEIPTLQTPCAVSLYWLLYSSLFWSLALSFSLTFWTTYFCPGFSGALGCVLPENNPVNETILLGCINPVVCSNVCRQQGFLFASVNTDCSCGNTPPMTIEHGNKCTVACLAPSDDQGCGGPNGKALVFEAGYFFDRTVMQVTV